MALRHAVLAALLDNEFSGYQLAKAFAVGVANFWHALPQQLYSELSKLEKEGLVAGREVVQTSRPNKRVFTVTAEGLAELERFVAADSRPTFIRDDLLVMVQTADHVDTARVIAQLDERAESALARIGGYEDLLALIRGDTPEADFLRDSPKVGPYLTCRRGLALERETRTWCLESAAVLRARLGTA
ncbi:PadR family transcriptional regulator [Streptomyces sp. NPDC020983]|uniref:PadR family transcriptional regulator n=1 Tax=Streptomyces sp. NPDC020983 TaxID=3365106 RepID=UPI0037B3F75C